MPNNNDKYLETEIENQSERTFACVKSRIRKALFQYWLDNAKFYFCKKKILKFSFTF